MNVRFLHSNGVTHEAKRANSVGGRTWCGIGFYFGSEPSFTTFSFLLAEQAPEDAECDCMACIARSEPAIEFSTVGSPVINSGDYKTLEFLFIDEDKETK